MAAPSAKDELETLEKARAQLEAALAGDEAWRALRQPASDDAQAAADGARRLRNMRLEKALANNELYKAWKHLNQAIDALRARHPELKAKAAEAAPGEAMPQPEAAASAHAARPRRRRLQSELRDKVGSEVPPGLLLTAESLMGRLADVAHGLEEAATSAPQAAASAAGERSTDPAIKDPAAKEDYDPLAHVADPPEATVTFVVREAPRPKDAGSQRAKGVRQEIAGSSQRSPGGAAPEPNAGSGAGGEQHAIPGRGRTR